MNKLMNDSNLVNDWECIDQELGDKVLIATDPATDEALRNRLNTHLEFCAACRMKLAIAKQTEAGLRDGRLKLGMPASKIYRINQIFASAGALALAACLALVFIMPPQNRLADVVLRGDSDKGIIESPLPDEKVLSGTPFISWTQLDGATEYNVQVQAVEGDYSWQQTTESNTVQIPGTSALPDDTRFRVVVKPVPSYLAPVTGVNSSFSRVSLFEFVWYRFAASPLALIIALMVCLLIVLGTGSASLVLRRRETI